MTHYTPCGEPHDPEPWLQYHMQTGQTGLAGAWKWRPRPQYCQLEECYAEARKEPQT